MQQQGQQQGQQQVAPPQFASLEEVAQRVTVCRDCGLSQGRTCAVPGEGPRNPQIMFVGEGPGFNEDQQGRPFVGAAGQFLEKLLALAGLKRPDVYITNIVKCRPPGNRDPLPGEVKACSNYLEAQIRFLKPQILVTLGRHSLGWFFPGETVTKARGKPREWRGITVVPMLHPAAALHQPGYRSTIEDDFRQLPVVLKQVLARLAEQPKAAEPVKQLNMFGM